MTRRQIEKFALGYPVPTDWDYDKDKVHEILCKGKEEIVVEIRENLYLK